MRHSDAHQDTLSDRQGAILRSAVLPRTETLRHSNAHTDALPDRQDLLLFFHGVGLRHSNTFADPLSSGEGTVLRVRLSLGILVRDADSQLYAIEHTDAVPDE